MKIFRNLKLLCILASIDVMADSGALLSSPPNVCEIRQPTWCVYLGAIEIIDRPSETVQYQSVWTVRGELEPKKPFLILEPRGCRKGLSDIVELISFDMNFKRDDKYWNRAVIRLKSDKTCDLELLTPPVENNEISEGFFNSLNFLQACTTANCDGPILGQKVRNLRERLEKADKTSK